MKRSALVLILVGLALAGCGGDKPAALEAAPVVPAPIDVAAPIVEAPATTITSARPTPAKVAAPKPAAAPVTTTTKPAPTTTTTVAPVETTTTTTVAAPVETTTTVASACSISVAKPVVAKYEEQTITLASTVPNAKVRFQVISWRSTIQTPTVQSFDKTTGPDGSVVFTWKPVGSDKEPAKVGASFPGAAHAPTCSASYEAPFTY